MPLGRSRSAVGTLPRSRARAYGARKRGQRRKVFCLATLLCEYPWSCRRFFFFLRQVIPYGAAHFDKVALLTTTQHNTPTNRRKPSAAEKGGSEVFPRPRQSNSHARQRRPSRAQRPGRPNAAEKGGSGVSPNYDTTQHAHAQKKAKRSGEAECCGKGGFESPS